jgi:hypothetical protein
MRFGLDEKHARASRELGAEACARDPAADDEHVAIAIPRAGLRNRRLGYGFESPAV